jgi:transposase
MKREYIRMGCGLDISKSQFHACFGVYTASGKFVIRASKKFKNQPSDIKAFLAWVSKQRSKLSKQGDLPFQLVMETTGVYHEHVLFAAYEAGLPVCLELAKKVKQYLHSLGQQSKTDKLDAAGICQLACERRCKRWKPLSPNIYSLRVALRHRKALLKSKNRFSNQLHAIKHSHTADKKVEASIRRLKKQIEKEIQTTEQRIMELYRADTYLYGRLEPIVESIKGLGLITALSVVAETNGFAQITSRKQLASYAGYDILENSSGEMSKKARISKKGNARIRSAMYMSAVCIIRTKQGPLYELFARVKKRNPKTYKIANVAVQRKLLLLIYTLFKKGEAFDHLKYGKIEEKHIDGSSELSPELHEIEPA